MNKKKSSFEKVIRMVGSNFDRPDLDNNGKLPGLLDSDNMHVVLNLHGMGRKVLRVDGKAMVVVTEGQNRMMDRKTQEDVET